MKRGGLILTSSKSYGEKIKKECKHCHNEFFVPAWRERSRLKETGKEVVFCSRKCADENKADKHKVKCDYCGSDTEKTMSRINKNKNHFCNKKCFSKYMAQHPNRKADGVWQENGYQVTYDGNGKGIKTHRKIMEEFLKRKLLKSEIVHHIDGNRKNNDIDNLKVMSIGEHSKLHRNEEVKNGKKLFVTEAEKRKQ